MFLAVYDQPLATTILVQQIMANLAITQLAWCISPVGQLEKPCARDLVKKRKFGYSIF